MASIITKQQNSSNLNARDIIWQRTQICHSTVTTILLLKTLYNSIFQAKIWCPCSQKFSTYMWVISFSNICTYFLANETIQYVLLECQHNYEETIALSDQCSLAKIQDTLNGFLNSRLTPHHDKMIFNASNEILRDKSTSVFLIMPHFCSQHNKEMK